MVHVPISCYTFEFTENLLESILKCYTFNVVLQLTMSVRMCFQSLLFVILSRSKITQAIMRATRTSTRMIITPTTTPRVVPLNPQKLGAAQQREIARIESCPEHVMGGWSSYSMGRRSQYTVSSMGGVGGAYYYCSDLQHKMTF